MDGENAARLDAAKKTIVSEALSDRGFLTLLHEDRIDERRFRRLMTAIDEAHRAARGVESLDRQLVAALFELTWGAHGDVDHYVEISVERGVRVAQMADTLRQAVRALFWEGVEGPRW